MPRHHRPQPFCNQFHFKEMCRRTGRLEACGIPPEVRIMVNKLTKNFRSKPRVWALYIGLPYIQLYDQDCIKVCVDKQEPGVDRGNVNYNHRNMRVWVSIEYASLERAVLYAYHS